MYGDDGDNNGENLILLFALLRGYIPFLLFLKLFEENEMLYFLFLFSQVGILYP